MRIMGYNGLTNIGSEYLAKCLANKTGVTFTKIKVGNGSIPGGSSGQQTTDLYGFKKEVEILAKEQVENAIKLTVLLNNIDLEAGFYVKELGVYVQDGEEEKLYWYINKDNPSFLPDKNTPSNHRYNLYLEVTPVETTVVNFTGQDLLADKKYVDDSIKNFQSQNDEKLEEMQRAIDGKEPKITKNTGFNLNKSDSFTDGGTNTLATSEAVKLGNIANMGATQNGTFPLTSATVGNTYRASNGKLYKCITAYNGSQISVPNENFEELSIWENSNRLSNLGIIVPLVINSIETTIIIPDNIEKYRILVFSVALTGSVANSFQFAFPKLLNGMVTTTGYQLNFLEPSTYMGGDYCALKFIPNEKKVIVLDSKSETPVSIYGIV